MASSLSSAGMKTTKAIAAHFLGEFVSRLAAKCGDEVNSFVCVSVSEVCAYTESLTHTHKITVKSPKAQGAGRARPSCDRQGALPQTDTRRV